MKSNIKNIGVQFSWLLICVVCSFLFTLLLFGKNIFKNTIDIHLHDNYFVLSPYHLLIVIFLLLCFVVYFIKEYKNSFKYNFNNCMFFVIGFLLLINLQIVIKIFSFVFRGGYTIYPPLSSLGPQNSTEIGKTATSSFIEYGCTIIQVVVLFILLYTAYRWGKSKRG